MPLIDRQLVAGAAGVVLAHVIEHGGIVVGFGSVEPEVDRERLAPVVVADIAAQEALVGLVEEECLSGDAVAKDRRLDDGSGYTGRRGG